MTTLAERIASTGIGMTFRRAEQNPNMDGEWSRGASHFRVTLSRRHPTRRMSLYFSQGSAITNPPTAEDVLYCLLSDASSADLDFEDWCGEYGYDSDSRKHEKTHRAVVRQTAKLRAFLGDDFDAFVYETEDA